MTKKRIEIPNEIRFVYFDVGNVFFSFSGGLEELAKKFGTNLEDVENYWKSKDDDICRGRLLPQEFWLEIKNKFNYCGKNINFINFWIDHFKIINNGHKLAKFLSKDYQLGLMTNAYPGVLQKVKEKGLIPNLNWVESIQ